MTIPKPFLVFFLLFLGGTCQCGPNAACDTGRHCSNATGVTYGDPDATFECSCLEVSHCPNTTDTCNNSTAPSLCQCSGNSPDFAPCEAPRNCLSLPGQPACSCLNATDCLENADTCNTTTTNTLCQCSTNDPGFEACNDGSVCQDITGQPGCSCLDSSECLENADTCNTTASPTTCECSTNGPTFEACFYESYCQNITGQPGCSCLTSSDCLDNADTCNATTTPPTCECSSNLPSLTACDVGRSCQTIVGQPPCSCADASQCLENADFCNATTTPPTCECSANTPDFDVCDAGRYCQTVLGQPGCSCLDASQCLDNADTCNSTTTPPSCECSSNAPTFSTCDDNRVCQTVTGQPACSCLNSTDCGDNADFCNATTTPPSCECSSNAPTFSTCENDRVCQSIVGQPACSCLTASDCSGFGDFCNTTTSPPTCECSTNTPTFSTCENDRVCQSVTDQPPCSCLDPTQCLDNADVCNTTTTPPSCECSANEPTFAPCENDRICQIVTGQPACSCLDSTQCLDNADTCNTTTAPPTCTCSTNTPSFEACDVDRECQNITGQPACSCQESSNCLSNADTCNTTKMPSTCECSTNGPNFEACDEGRECQNVTGQPGCSCMDATQCLLNADTCNSTATPPSCQCSKNLPSFEVCDEGSLCQDIPGQPGCSCLDDSQCLENADSCNTTTNPATCTCSHNAPNLTACDEGSLCQDIPGQPGCSCLDDSQCLENADSCNTTTNPATCTCSHNAPNFTACDEGRYCMPVVPGHPACSCLDATQCLENADTCNSTTTPPSCECSGNAPTFAPCEGDRLCMSSLNIQGQPACSCSNDTDCLENADSCDTSTSPPTCKCGEGDAGPPGSVCLTNYTITGSLCPGFSCLEGSHCGNSSNECDATNDPPLCKCNGNTPCEPGRICQDIKEQPECSCLLNDHCTDTSDTCDITKDPPECGCGDGPPCIGDKCVEGQCGVSIPVQKSKMAYTSSCHLNESFSH